ncbi:ABC transporter ATP-binding protein [Rhodococcus erythropolis]|uniref:ABC transporter ATP-binding protein n=1 Tax=Rhodococcus erythropolis TaxID=1833 RepID=A0A5N5DXC0_RHOER|nr:ABC transporter ATP-binding protein [Rhodococcus erythropolis]
MTRHECSTGDDPILRVRNLSIAFGTGTTKVSRVNGVDFDLYGGECLAIVGESGSGKSVTARSLIGLPGKHAIVTADSMSLRGKDLRGISEARWRKIRGSEIGYILQDALVSLDPLRTIGREIDDSLRLHTAHSRRERKQMVLDLLRDVGIPDPDQRIGQRSGELSGGLRQRALIASSVALSPPVLIADEPTTALDATVQQQILALLDSLQDDADTALLLISHDLAVVSRMADRIAVMRNGEFVESGLTAQVLEDPQHQYTKKLLRAVPAGRPRGSALSDATVAAAPIQWSSPIRPAEPHLDQSDTNPVLEAHRLRKVYRNPDGSARVAVDDVSLALSAGTTLGIVGESGSGKTTVARMILGLVEPDFGEVRFAGGPWSTLPEKKRRPLRHQIAAIYQDPLGSFDPLWTVGKILTDALGDSRTTPKARRTEEVERLLDTVGLDPDTAERNPSRLSGGQRQRVAIARALATRPTVIVCDEPVSALDVSIQAQILDLLDELQREFALSYVFISHDLGVVQHISDEIIVMSDGNIVESGTAREVFENPTQEYTKRLLTAAPRLESTVKGKS